MKLKMCIHLHAIDLIIYHRYQNQLNKLCCHFLPLKWYTLLLYLCISIYLLCLRVHQNLSYMVNIVDTPKIHVNTIKLSILYTIYSFTPFTEIGDYWIIDGRWQSFSYQTKQKKNCKRDAGIFHLHKLVGCHKSRLFMNVLYFHFVAFNWWNYLWIPFMYKNDYYMNQPALSN